MPQLLEQEPLRQSLWGHSQCLFIQIFRLLCLPSCVGRSTHVSCPQRKRKRKSYAHRIHPRRESRKVVSLAKNPHRYPQSESNWGPLRTSPPSRSLTSCSGPKNNRALRHAIYSAKANNTETATFMFLQCWGWAPIPIPNFETPTPIHVAF